MPKVVIAPIFDFETPTDASGQFPVVQRDMDAQSWRGRASTMELPIGGEHGAGGNMDSGSNAPGEGRMNKTSSGSFRIAGPSDVTGKGSTAVGGKRK